MKTSSLALLCGLLLCTSCLTPDEPSPVEYRLTGMQKAWQPHSMGDRLRFGNAQNSQIRTYKITEVDDKLEEQSTGSVYVVVPFGSRQKSVLVQRVAVRAQRTDSITSQIPLLNFQLSYDPDHRAPVLTFSEVSWEGFYRATLPIDSANTGRPINQRFYPGVSLLPVLNLGSIRWENVLAVENRYPQFTPPGIRPVSLLYYARQWGVIGFVEGDTHWYRLIF